MSCMDFLRISRYMKEERIEFRAVFVIFNLLIRTTMRIRRTRIRAQRAAFSNFNTNRSHAGAFLVVPRKTDERISEGRNR